VERQSDAWCRWCGVGLPSIHRSRHRPCARGSGHARGGKPALSSAGRCHVPCGSSCDHACGGKRARPCRGSRRRSGAGCCGCTCAARSAAGRWGMRSGCGRCSVRFRLTAVSRCARATGADEREADCAKHGLVHVSPAASWRAFTRRSLRSERSRPAIKRGLSRPPAFAAGRAPKSIYWPYLANAAY
jgi:hypothetical protein